MRAIGRDESQPDAASGPGEPGLGQLGVVIAGIVEKDMDRRLERMHGFDGGEEPDGREGVDGFGFDHPGPPGLQIDGAVDVDALAPAGLLDGRPATGGRPAARSPRDPQDTQTYDLGPTRHSRL